MAVTQGSAFLETFAQFDKTLGSNGQSWFTPTRKAAMARFAELGLPTTRDEEWRFTNVSPIGQTNFKPAEGRADISLDMLQPFLFGEKCRLVFVNGRHAPALSETSAVPTGVKLSSLASALKQGHPVVKSHLARHAEYEKHAFTALNTAFWEDGAFIEVGRNQVVDGPIHLLFVSTGDREPTMSHPRNLIVAEDGSQFTIVESYVGLGGGVYFTNAVTEIVAGENAVVDHYKLQRESEASFHIATCDLHQSRSSNITSMSLAIGGGLVRNDVHTVLDGEGGDCTLNGLYMMAGKQHVDNHLRVEHAKPHCHSWEYYKGILDGASRAVFTGRIIVHKDAQKTDAKQTNKNLLLSDDATINTKPQLEIYADDVKCTHGATIGQIDADALFYLRARGIPEAAARNLLIYAFAAESLDQIKIEPLKKQLEQLLIKRLPGGERLEEVV